MENLDESITLSSLSIQKEDDVEKISNEYKECTAKLNTIMEEIKIQEKVFNSLNDDARVGQYNSEYLEIRKAEIDALSQQLNREKKRKEIIDEILGNMQDCLNFRLNPENCIGLYNNLQISNMPFKRKLQGTKLNYECTCKNTFSQPSRLITHVNSTESCRQRVDIMELMWWTKPSKSQESDDSDNQDKISVTHSE